VNDFGQGWSEMRWSTTEIRIDEIWYGNIGSTTQWRRDQELNAEAAVTDHHYQVNEVQPPVPQSLTSTVAPQQPKPIDQQQQQLNNRIKD
jgi:hypothetical protein